LLKLKRKEILKRCSAGKKTDADEVRVRDVDFFDQKGAGKHPELRTGEDSPTPLHGEMKANLQKITIQLQT